MPSAMTRCARIGLAMLVMEAGTGAAFGQDVSKRPFSTSALARLVHESSGRGVRLAQNASSESGQRNDCVLDGALTGAAIGGIGGSFLFVAGRGGSDDFGGAMLKAAP
jgi:hypothetical protein